MTSVVYEPGEPRRNEDFMMRVDRRVIERAIELMIEDLEEEIRRGL